MRKCKSKTEKDKSERISVAVGVKTAKRLKSMKHGSVWVREIIEKELGVCPSCGGDI